MSTNEFVVVLTTLPSDADAGSVASALVDRRLAACVNILGDMRSVYRWNDEVEVEHERQLVIKTTSDALPRLWEYLQGDHPYENAEFLVLPVIDGSGAYLNWIRESTTSHDA
jgi:periplasmic divalent cation tolerance protein